METTKDKENVFIDLRKLSEEKRKHIFSLLPERKKTVQYWFDNHNSLLYFDNEDGLWWVYGDIAPVDKQELTYSQFLDMMGESEEKSKVIENSEKELINNDGTLYIGEGLENYYKDQLERTGKFKVVAIEDYNKLQILLNNKPNPDYQSDPFPGQLG